MAKMADKSIVDRKKSASKNAERESIQNDLIWLGSMERNKMNEVISMAGRKSVMNAWKA